MVKVRHSPKFAGREWPRIIVRNIFLLHEFYTVQTELHNSPFRGAYIEMIFEALCKNVQLFGSLYVSWRSMMTTSPA